MFHYKSIYSLTLDAVQSDASRGNRFMFSIWVSPHYSVFLHYSVSLHYSVTPHYSVSPHCSVSLHYSASSWRMHWLLTRFTPATHYAHILDNKIPTTSSSVNNMSDELWWKFKWINNAHSSIETSNINATHLWLIGCMVVIMYKLLS